MNRHPSRKISVLVALGLLACAKDPGAGKTAAEVKPAQQEKPLEAAADAKAEKLAITPDNSTIKFVGAKVTAQHPGSFKDFKGEIELVGGDPTKSRVMMEIQNASLTIDQENMEKLVGHLKSPDFFDVEKFPVAKFMSTELKKGSEVAGYNYTVVGNLTLRDATKSVTFPAQIDVGADGVTVKSEFSINRKDWGIVYPGKPDDLIKDNILIQLDLHPKRAAKI